MLHFLATMQPDDSFLHFLIRPILPTDCRCRWLILHLTTLNDKHIHAIGVLWTRDQLVAETSTWHHTTVTWGRHATGGIWTRSPSKRLAADLKLRRYGHRDQSLLFLPPLNSFASVTIAPVPTPKLPKRSLLSSISGVHMANCADT